jgi:6-pyruvoyltetrahydropterin/6-carboxytetrahydropterin synthase
MPNHTQRQILRRTVRFSINPDGSMQGENSFAGKPSSIGFSHYYEIQLAIIGSPDPHTGYIIGIQEIDSIVRNHFYPIIANQIRSDASSNPTLLLPELWSIASEQINQRAPHHALSAIKWNLTPYYSIEMNSSDSQSHSNPQSVLLRERFDFSAAHRLDSPNLTAQENIDFFGKCNNPAGHGHNYQLEPCVRIPISTLDSDKNRHFQIEIQQLVNSILLETLDHKFLNTDCPWFDHSQGGVIPSVENIARVCYEKLAPSIAQLGDGVELKSMTTWETEKTSSIYPAEHA